MSNTSKIKEALKITKLALNAYAPKVKKTMEPLMEKAINETKNQLNKSIDLIVDHFKSNELDKKYEEYKSYCLEKGKVIQSKEQFKEMMEYLKSFKEEVKDVDFYNIITQISKDYILAKGSLLGVSLKVVDTIMELKKSYNTADKEDSINTNTNEKNKATVDNIAPVNDSKVAPEEKSAVLKTKKSKETKNSVFKNWLQVSNVTYSKSKSNEMTLNLLYSNYLIYCEKNNNNDYTYLYQNFCLELQRNLPKLVKVPVPDSKEIKVNLNFK